MAKVSVCDVCRTRHNKLTKATKYMHVKGHKDLRIDLCSVHIFEVQRKFPKVSVGYVQFIYEMVHGIELSPEDAENVLRTRR